MLYTRWAGEETRHREAQRAGVGRGGADYVDAVLCVEDAPCPLRLVGPASMPETYDDGRHIRRKMAHAHRRTVSDGRTGGHRRRVFFFLVCVFAPKLQYFSFPKQRLSQSTEINQPIKSIDQPINQSTSQSINRLINRTANQPANQSASQPINQPISEPTSRPINRPISQSANQSTNQAINQPISQPANQSIN